MAARTTAIWMALAGLTTGASAQDVLLTSSWGEVHAVLDANPAAQALADQLPLTIRMRDHLRQEKTGDLPSPLPGMPRQRSFSAGLLGLWGPDHFVIYYPDGTVPEPGIVPLGWGTDDVSIFDRPGDITVELVTK